ncbi:siderophore-interacting protein [Pseudochelatococcus sp. B33]
MIRDEEDFRWMRVADTQRIAPRMQRLRLEGDNLRRFDTDANLHVRLHIPNRPGDASRPPISGRAGRPLEAIDPVAVATRYYTIRRIDAAAGWVDIDFVLHEAPGPAGDFAHAARIGDICGMSGPCGLGVKPARRYLLAGDETALPAIARIAEALPAGATGDIVIEVDTPEDRLPLSMPPGLSCRWLYRSRQDGCGGFVATVSQAITATAAGIRDHFVWIAGEFAAYEALLAPLKAIAKTRRICVPYWRAGNHKQTD